MDEIIPNIVDNNNSIDAPIGCSTICVNEPNAVRIIYAIPTLSLLIIFIGNFGSY